MQTTRITQITSKIRTVNDFHKNQIFPRFKSNNTSFKLDTMVVGYFKKITLISNFSTYRISNVVVYAGIFIVFAMDKRVAIACAVDLVDDIYFSTHFE